MIDLLRRAITQVNSDGRVNDPDQWSTLYIDYEKPIVERAWTKVRLDGNEYRLYVHHIHPCKRGEAFYHPHPWPSAVLVCDAGYETAFGYGDPNGPPPPKVGPVFFGSWTTYQMLTPFEWHYVRPLQLGTSIMLTGAPFKVTKEQAPKPPMRQLSQMGGVGVRHSVFGRYGFAGRAIEVLQRNLEAGDD